MRILMVDDSKESRSLIEMSLRRSGYTDLVFAESASEALAYLTDPQLGKSIDLILMDVLMPGMNGIETCRDIKSIEGLRDVPIIMITADSEVDDLDKAFAAGASDYICKPPNRVELAARLRTALRLKSESDQRKAREAELTQVKHALEQANAKLHLVSKTDALTGLPNRRALDDFVAFQWPRSVRNRETISVMMIDIDDFKGYNDRYGHVSGDSCLTAVASVLCEHLRRSSDLIVRYGGEEFVVLLAGTARDVAASLGECLREKVESLRIPHAGSRVAAVVTVSIGVATFHASHGVKEDAFLNLLRTADEALYVAKRSGRNRVCVEHVRIIERPGERLATTIKPASA